MGSICLFILLFFVLNSCNQNTGSKNADIVPFVKERKAQQDFTIFNEPSGNKITIVFYATEQGQAVINIYYADGKLLDRKQLVVSKGKNVWDYYFPFRSNGIYLVKFIMKNVERSGKVFKTNPQ